MSPCSDAYGPNSGQRSSSSHRLSIKWDKGSTDIATHDSWDERAVVVLSLSMMYPLTSVILLMYTMQLSWSRRQSEWVCIRCQLLARLYGGGLRQWMDVFSRDEQRPVCRTLLADVTWSRLCWGQAVSFARRAWSVMYRHDQSSNHQTVQCCFVAVCVLCQALCATTCRAVTKQHSTLSSRYYRATLCVTWSLLSAGVCQSVRLYVWHVRVLVLYPKRGLQGPNGSCCLCPSNERKVSVRVNWHRHTW